MRGLSGEAVAGPTISCTLSIGVASYPTSGTTMNDLFHAADTTLYDAKNSGRNTVKLHAPAPEARPDPPRVLAR